MLSTGHTICMTDFEGINWRDDEADELAADLQVTHQLLTKELYQDVQPIDVVVGGIIADSEFSYTDDAVRVERFDAGDGLVAYISQGRCDGTTRANMAMLRRHDRDAWGWVPKVRQNRTAAIAEMIKNTNWLQVKLYDIAKPVDDDKTLLAIRNGVIKPTVKAGSNGYEPLDKADVLETALGQARGVHERAYVDERRYETMAPEELKALRYEAFVICGGVQLTDEEVRAKAQPLVDGRLAKIQNTVITMQTALETCITGRRIRPRR